MPIDVLAEAVVRAHEQQLAPDALADLLSRSRGLLSLRDPDIYFEARDLPREFNRTDPNRRWHVFGLPSGALLDNLRRRRQFAFDLIESALVVTDREPFRAAMVAINAEGLTPAAPE